jgi:hypothetical protein
MATQNNQLNKEIEETSKRIEVRQKQIDVELQSLSVQIRVYTSWAWRFVVIGALIIVVAIIIYCIKNTDAGFGLNLLGDFMAGSVGAIWSLAGLFFIYVAFLGQKQQLLNQQLEIMYSQLEVRYTRLELVGQKEEMIEQNKTLRQQRFENTFFQMLSLFNSIVNSLDIRNRKTRSVTTSGRDCFEVFYRKLTIHLSHILKEKDPTNENLDTASVSEAISAYDELYSNDKSDMSHYFRTIYHIIKFVDRSNVDSKKQYIAIARAQLSSYEQILIFYNCLHNNGVEKFKPLIEKYALFKNIDRSLIINQDHLEAYKKGAYGE